ncbi:leucine-rich repeat and calponin homology domain-containing protein 4 [Xenopus tropicalis]|uniref:Leucine-rich repeat and calponin homology domain-containing protein 4 n=1 Tax=Xenopus tropicalis TaxID=8364 RepID=A0A8J1J8Q4_XENTR|nr:leucine-rich repeat and calponin homology domain-containing protein 4 [Xenopus tropicalis]
MSRRGRKETIRSSWAFVRQRERYRENKAEETQCKKAERRPTIGCRLAAALTQFIPFAMAAGNDEEEGGGGDGDPELSRAESCQGSGSRRSAEKALEEAASTGVLSLSGRRMKELPRSARNYDLTDITRADLSKNRLSEVPADICQLVSLESLNLYHNCLRFIPPALSNLQVLTHLNISRNLLPSLPPCICRLPLTVLIASNNKLGALPEEIGTMTSLRQLDVSCNDLQALPPQMGSLGCLRDLNARRNQLSALPEELSELPLIRLDLSCNRITHIPVCYRHLRHLQTVILENNPLQYPPAQICLKGKVHIFKYLNIEACSKPVSELGVKLSRPTSLTTCLTEEIYSSRPYGGLDSGFNSVDSGSKRWSGNESADELTDLSLRIAGFAGDSKQLREKLNGTEGDTEHTDVESTNEEEEETKSDCGLQMTPQDKQKPEHHSTPRSEEKTMVSGAAPSPVSPTVGRPDPPTEERRRPETLLLWRERERQQLQQRQEAPRRQSADRKESLQKVPSNSTLPSAPPSSDVANGPADTANRLRSQVGGFHWGEWRIMGMGSLMAPVFMFLASSPSELGPVDQCSPVRLRNCRPPIDEKALLAQLRKVHALLLCPLCTPAFLLTPIRGRSFLPPPPRFLVGNPRNVSFQGDLGRRWSSPCRVVPEYHAQQNISALLTVSSASAQDIELSSDTSRLCRGEPHWGALSPNRTRSDTGAATCCKSPAASYHPLALFTTFSVLIAQHVPVSPKLNLAVKRQEDGTHVNMSLLECPGRIGVLSWVAFYPVLHLDLPRRPLPRLLLAGNTPPCSIHLIPPSCYHHHAPSAPALSLYPDPCNNRATLVPSAPPRNRRDQLCLGADSPGRAEHDSSLVVQRTVSSLLLLPPGEASSLPPTPEAESCPAGASLLPPHTGFLLFYALSMLALYVAYSRLVGV